MDFETTVHAVGTAVDLAGVGVIILGALATTVRFGVRATRTQDFTAVYREYRQGLGRSILLGLEFLVAGDIIRTVAISPTFESVGVLAAIVLVRTFLSFSLEKELEHGRAAASSPERSGG
ncbi:DUF1622 domain-containing protein [Glycomyces sp. TRM65418]|uniref:DUF1622 domain-containing protein n=1 Tax=Glycomyces sp. TRM65418 TaxID=2867006 RepID=UPI001CE51786|nr:DUF1622 domain-containing protein [Glycomyces sp. TRM65418]MCC3763415.1 DUF1622 domain-containing protein [Glycomyces sp. TRM65418]QZD57406.1 DUF1622 domain-containing protein [Glycomyces sp. TRM65418]